MTSKCSSLLSITAIMASAAFTVVMAAQDGPVDWPQWRGPNRDGAAASFAEPDRGRSSSH